MAENKKNPLSFINPVLGSAMDFAVNNSMAGLASGRQFGYSRKMFDYTFAQQNQRQDWLNANSALIQKQSLKNAGLSASNLNGTPFSANVATGGSLSGSAEFAQMNMISNMLQAKQIDIQDKLADAQVAKMDAETANIEKNTSWVDRLNQSTIDAQKAKEELDLGTNKREAERLKVEVDNYLANIDLTKEQTNYQKIVNDANNKVYNYNGTWVKGSEIPNFNTLVNLHIAEEMLKVAKYNAETGRREVDGNPLKLLVNEFGKPVVDFFKKLNVSPESYIGLVKTAILGLISAFSQNPDNPFGFLEESKTEVGGEPVE